MRAWPGRDTWLGILLVVVIGVLVLVPVGFIILGSFNTARPGEPLRLSIDPWRQALQSR